MNHRDIAVLMDGIAPVLRGYVEKAFEPVVARMAALERDMAELSATPKEADPALVLRLVEETVAKNPAPAGRDGKDADPDLVAELVDKAVAALDPAKDGEPGPAGESVTVEQLAPLVAETVAKAVSDELEKIAANLPAGKDGAPGEPGKSVTLEELAPVVDEIVLRRVSELPPAKDGADGKEGAPGRDGRDGLPGVQGEKGFDGRNGVDGKDGFSLTDFKMSSDDDGRTITLEFEREDRDPEVRWIKTATILDRGVWREQAYEKGDGVTWGGSFFIAQRQTSHNEKPGEGNDAFRLAVKRGRDGKEGPQGKQGEKGLKGDPGTPGRNY